MSRPPAAAARKAAARKAADGGATASGTFVVHGPRRSLELAPPEEGGRTAVMGILNVTPDSFSDGGLHLSPLAAVERALRMAEEGADVVDVGGESTRPGALPVEPAVQMDRVCPVIEKIRAASDVLASVDTTCAEVAAAALEAGADWVNDTSALQDDPDMLPLLARTGAPVVLMHRPRPARTMQQDPSYRDAPVEVRDWLARRVELALAGGVARDRILVDPGLGFGKRPQDNLDLVARLEELAELGLPVVVGPSRKSFLGVLLGREVHERLVGTAACAAVAAWLGAHVLRVHDVAHVADAVRVACALRARAKGAPWTS